MSAKTPLLFIGGPRDGMRMVVEGAPHTIELPVLGPICRPDEMPRVANIYYHRVRLMNANAQPVECYAIYGVDVIAALIAHYRPGAE